VINVRLPALPCPAALTYTQGFFPKIADKRHGYIKGLRLLPMYAAMDNETFKEVRAGSLLF
jgi:hypothetical protein